MFFSHSLFRVSGTFALVFSLALPFTAFADDDFFHTAAIGPGVENLSPSDTYAEYQWGFKNHGDLQLVEIRDRFAYGGSSYVPPSESSSGFAIPLQPGSLETVTTTATAGIDINLLPAWNLYDSATDTREVTVAVIDTGANLFHPDLKDSVWTNPGEIPWDNIDNDGNGYVDDYYGWNFFYNNPFVFSGSAEDTHGTHVAGIISAKRENGGVVGITGPINGNSPKIKIMILKALGTSQGIGTPEDVVAAIRYAEANGASICNLSFCSSTYSQELADTIQASSMLFVVAAGNGDEQGIGYNIDSAPVYPASLPYDNIIVVSSLDFNGALNTSSNYGPTSTDIAAPGSYIVSTTPEGFGFLSGTSMAAPMVTGTAALLYSYHPDFSLQDIRTAILQSARPLDSLAGTCSTGGMLDAGNAFLWEKPV